MSTPMEPPASGAQAKQPWATHPDAGQGEAGHPEDSRPQASRSWQTPPEAGRPEGASTPYLPTLISGLVVLTVTVLVTLAKLTHIDVDLGLVLPVGMVATGALLVLGAVLAAVRAGRRADG